MNSIVTSPTPPTRRRINRNCRSVTPAIGASTSGGSIVWEPSCNISVAQHRRCLRRRPRNVPFGGVAFRRRPRAPRRGPTCPARPGSTPTRASAPRVSGRSAPSSIARLASRTARGPLAAIVLASSFAARSSSSAPGHHAIGHTVGESLSASCISAPKIQRLARPGPIRRGNRCVPPAPGMIASAVSRKPILASSARIRRSQAKRKFAAAARRRTAHRRDRREGQVRPADCKRRPAVGTNGPHLVGAHPLRVP